VRGAIRLVLVALSLLGTGTLFLWRSISTPRLFILQSYDGEYPWTQSVEIGIHRVLDAETEPFAVRWHYMDTKRHPWEHYKRNAGIEARQEIDRWKPDVILAVDDDAQDLVTRYYVDRPDVRIVFAGVNADPAKYGLEQASNATGILERTPWNAMKDALLDSNISSRRPIRLVHVGDGSGPVADDDKNLHAFKWGPEVEVLDSMLGNRTFDAWKSAIAQAQERADVILIDGYRQIARSESDHTLVPPKEVVEWTETSSRLPLVGNNGFFVDDGGALAIGASPYEQGEISARMAIELLAGRRGAKDIPEDTTHQLVVFMRKSRLQVRGIRLPGIYEAFARATNHYLP
jgi:ABC transporter substrate binding protein